jgi:hypothetical protein
LSFGTNISAPMKLRGFHTNVTKKGYHLSSNLRN